MQINAYYSEYERPLSPDEPDDWPGSGCPTYPVIVTDEHATCSYGQYVILTDGQARGYADMPYGELQLTTAQMVHADRLRSSGYEVCDVEDNTYGAWLDTLDQAPLMTEHHPIADARWVSY